VNEAAKLVARRPTEAAGAASSSSNSGTLKESEVNGRGQWPDGHHVYNAVVTRGENGEQLRVVEELRTTKSSDNGVRNESSVNCVGSQAGVDTFPGDDKSTGGEAEENSLTENGGAATQQENGGKSGLQNVEGGDTSAARGKKFNHGDERQGWKLIR